MGKDKKGQKMNRDEVANANVQLIKDLIAAVDSGNYDVADQFYDTQYVDHDPSPIRATAKGLEGARRALEIAYAGFPDAQHEIRDIFGNGNKVVARIYSKATHTGELFGIPPTGKQVELEGIAIYRIEDGKIVERWCYNGRGLIEQITE